MQRKYIVHSVQQWPDDFLGLGILAPDAAHVPGAAGFGEAVHCEKAKG
jgi:hypothetical protein